VERLSSRNYNDGMFRRLPLWLLLAAGFSPALAAQVSARARALHQDAFVFDAHVHMINRQFYLGGGIGERYPDGQVDLARMKEGGVDAFLMTLYVQEEYYPQRMETKHLLRLMDLAWREIERNRDRLEAAFNADDIERIHRAGKMAAVLDLEGGFDLDGDLGVLRMLHRLGLRAVEIAAHNWTSNFSDSCCAPARWGGLSAHGRQVVREMNRLGILINVSHASDETILDALEVSSQPLVATHHGLRSFVDIPRNLPEELLKKLAAKGGVIGFHIGNSFHNRRFFEWSTRRAGKPFWDTSEIGRRRAELTIFDIDRMLRKGYPSVGLEAPEEVLFSVDEWFQVVDRAIELVGEDHVALGSDFDGGPTPPRPMRDIGDLPMLTEAMLRRGYSEERIRKFLGGNLLRVFRQITQGARP